jgi:transglutaminase/protease-like cytokinesis protein 3
MTEGVLSPNPFLDPYNIPQGGKITKVGEKLTKLEIPNIQTLVYKTTNNVEDLAAVNVNDALLRAGITPRQPVVFKDEAAFGIELPLMLLGTPAPSSQVSPATLQTGKVIGRYIPTNIQEAKDVLHLIVPQRSGSKNTAFDINELRQIARNLQLPASGNKDVLANSIRSHIIQEYQL